MLTESRALQDKAVLLISALIVVGLLGYAVIVVSGVEFFQSIPYWFIVPHRTAVNSWIVAAALAFIVVTLICVHTSVCRRNCDSVFFRNGKRGDRFNR